MRFLRSKDRFLALLGTPMGTRLADLFTSYGGELAMEE